MSRGGRYSLHGVVVCSEIPIDEPSINTEHADLEVHVTSSRMPALGSPTDNLVAELVMFGKRWYSVYDARDGLLVVFPGLAEFFIDQINSTIECRPDPDTDPRALGLLLSGTVLSIYMSARGQCVLHASAVEVDDRAVVFAGLSGMGKSTCAALACAIGAPLVTDDVLVVDPEGGPVCRRGTSSIRLRRSASSIVEMFSSSPETSVTFDDRIAITPVRAAETMQLAGIVIPRPSHERSNLLVEQRKPSRAVGDLLTFLRIPGWRRSDVVANQFRQVTAIANEVPVLLATIPWGPPFSLEPMKELLDRVTS